MKKIKNEKFHRKLIKHIVGRKKSLIDFNKEKEEALVKISVYGKYNILYVDVDELTARILSFVYTDKDLDPVKDFAYKNATSRIIERMKKYN